MENITDANYVHAKRVEYQEYHDLYVQNDTLLLADVFGIFRNCVLTYMGLILRNFFQLWA